MLLAQIKDSAPTPGRRLHRLTTTLVAMILGSFLFGTSASGQGVFLPIGIPRTATGTGHTELAGPIHLALHSGTTLADTVVVDPGPFKITNANAADIRVTSSGNLVATAPTIDSAENLLRVPINAGGSSGSVRIEGLRLSLSNSGAASVPVRVFFGQSQNVMLPWFDVNVIDAILPGLTAPEMTDRFFVYNDQVVDENAVVTVAEGFASSFTSSSDFGQTGGTRIRIKVSDFPAGLQMQFPSSLSAAKTGATLTTVEGHAIKLPRPDGNTEVTYVYSQAADSSKKLESFDITFTVTTTGTVEVLQPTIEISLAPIGTDVPTASFPSTAIPRFSEENIVVLAGSSRIITQRLYWTGIEPNFENRLRLSNSGQRTSNVTVEGLLKNGGSLARSTVTLPAGQSWTESLNSLFGTSLENLAAIEVQSTGDGLFAVGTVFGENSEESTVLAQRGVFDFIIPAGLENDRISLLNTGASPANGTLRLKSKTGSDIGEFSLSLEPRASFSSSLSETFAQGSGAYISGTFDRPVVGAVSSPSAEQLRITTARVATGTPLLFIPLTVSGNGYESILTLINPTTEKLSLTATINGETLSETSTEITLQPGESITRPVTDIFDPVAALSVGYVRLNIPGVSRGFFTSYPNIDGHVEIRSGAGRSSTTIPISRYAWTTATLFHLAVSRPSFAGVAMVNPGPSSVTVTLRLQEADGTLLEAASLSLEPGQMISRLVGEIFAATSPQDLVLGLQASAPIFATALAGSLDGESLRWVPLLR